MNNSQIIEALREAMDSCQDRVLNWDCSVKDYIPKSVVLTILTRRFHSLITQLEQAGEVDKHERPSCFGSTRGGQRRAESDCDTCPHDTACAEAWGMKGRE